MLRSFGVSTARSIVISGSAVLAVCGWVGGVLIVLATGWSAGVNPWYLLSLSVGICFTITLCQAVVTPNTGRMYALGSREGYALALKHYGIDPDEGARKPLWLVGQR